MGIYERDYTRQSSSPGNPFSAISRTAVGMLIFACVVVWFVQIVVGENPGATGFFAAQPEAVFNGHIWKLVTAMFAHDTRGLGHLAINMLFLYFFGREIEQMYGKRDFFILYFSAGILSILAECILLILTEPAPPMVLGASGAVMAVTVLFAFHFPHRRILLFFLIPMPIWLLCVIFVVQDLLGVLDAANGVANMGHLAGVAVGTLYRFVDLRWTRVRGWFTQSQKGGRPRRQLRVRAGEGKKHLLSARSSPADSPSVPEEDPVSRRIDELLAKISSEGKESLTEEEWQFLKKNSGRYRSP